MMTPRVLKKISKKADYYIGIIGTSKEKIIYDEDSPASDLRMERKHLERFGGNPNKGGYYRPMKGTIAYGEMSGYSEPEWEQSTAYDLLEDVLSDYFWEHNHRLPITPAKVFKMARKMIFDEFLLKKGNQKNELPINQSYK